MRKFLILMAALTLCGAIGATAQEAQPNASTIKKFEHNFYVAAGLFSERFDDAYNSYHLTRKEKGLSYKFGYGLNYYFTEIFSVMPGLAYRREAVHPFSWFDGGDYDRFSFVDIPVVAQIHLRDSECKDHRWMLGFGVVYSYCVQNTKYYEDYEPASPLQDKNEIRDHSLSLMPCVAYETKRVRLGLEALIGTGDVNRKYDGIYTGKKYLYNLNAVFGVKF